MNKQAALTPNQKHIIVDKGTEPSFSGRYIEAVKEGRYLCRQCGNALFSADNQFTATCGWPSFDADLSDTVKCCPDTDGRRTEIVCERCDAHLGHVFAGENYTEKNTRHCVNSLAIEFVNDETVRDTQEAIIAGGCFWGVEYLLQQLEGVLLTEVGYIGGEMAAPTYDDICTKKTGHLEALRVVFDPSRVSYEQVLQRFFETHDFSQTDGQGPDLGPQYLSAVFYYTPDQQAVAQSVMLDLQARGLEVATQLYPMTTFWPAEDYHQNYYLNTGKQPYCHTRRIIFSDC